MAQSAAHESELQHQLQTLDQELEEGEITTKGYEKRRTLLFAQYGHEQPLSDPTQHPSNYASSTPEHVAASSGSMGLRIHNPDDTNHPSSGNLREPSAYPDAHHDSYGSGAPPSVQDPSYHHSNGHGRGSISSHQDYLQPGSGPAGKLQIRNGPPAGTLAPPSHQLPQQVPYDVSLQNSSRSPTMRSSNYAFNPEHDVGYTPPEEGGYDPNNAQTRSSTMVDQNFFSDFAGQQQGGGPGYGGPQRYSDAFSPSAAAAPPLLKSGDLPSAATINHLLPLEPREFNFAVYDPHDSNTPMSRFDNIGAILRHRASTIPKHTAYWVLDQKGKEISSITWDKLASRAEKVAQVIRDKSNLYRGDRVALIYRDIEVVDFAVALMGCFIAGVVAVPINDLRDYNRLNVVLTTTQAHLALTSDTNLKNFQRMITENKLSWPKGVEWWKTNDFGSSHYKKRGDMPALEVPDLAYIEFSRAPTGDLRGVVLSHRTVMHQLACLSAILATVPSEHGAASSGARGQSGRSFPGSNTGETLISYLDPRQSIGMILGVLLSVYGGHTVVWMEHEAITTPGLYASLISRYKATLMLADYPGLKQVVFNYQSDPMATRNFMKKAEPSFASLKLCMIDTLTVEPDFHEVLADRWLRPLRNPRAREIVAPLLCLPEHGGMVISMRDWLGGEERMGCPLNTFEPEQEEMPLPEETKPTPAPNGFSSLIGNATSKPKRTVERKELNEVLLDKESLKTNEVVVVAVGEEARRRAGEAGTIRVGAFGYPLPDATLAVVDPETSLLCTPHIIGEIWVDTPSLSGGFWALPKHTQTIFHARPYNFVEGNPNPTPVEPEFLRTGLLGTVIEGKIYILGLYEDRLRQKVEWVEHGVEVAEYRYFFVQHLIISIMKNIPKIYDASAFDVFVNDEYLPIILLESAAASTAPQTSGGPPRPLDTPLLDSISERCMEVLYLEHHLRVYCVMITAPDVLPRHWKNGRREIGNMLCRRDFDAGALACVHVKFGVERSVLNLPIGVDPVGGIWSATSSSARSDTLELQDKQYSGVDFREVVIDDRTSTPLSNFASIVDLFQWRVARQAEELALCTVDARGREGKGVTWKKFDQKVAAVAIHLQNKCHLRPGDRAILMYTHSEDFIFAIHACFCMGIVALPMAPVDQNRLNEDAPAFLHIVGDYKVKAILVNAEVNDLLKQKLVSQHMKQSAQVLRIGVPPVYNTSRASKQSSGCRDLGLTAKPNWVQPGHAALIWTYWSPDQRRTAVQLGHDTIMGICKVQKETCQMTSSRPVLGCVRSTSGLGFVHTCLMGVFVGAPTYLVSPVDFAANPLTLFHALARYKIKDTYATAQMLDHAMASMPAKGFMLHELKNMMISMETRPRLDVYARVRHYFAGVGLERTAINTIYSHVLNPMIASRSYMCIEPIELWLDTKSLRRGLIYPVDHETDPTALLLQDSGMVPVCTQLAIVNPETCQLCRVGEYGEIWVQSEACVSAFYGSTDAFDAERFNGRIADGDPNVRWVRTGDLGFLHSVTRPIGLNGQPIEMQVLFVLGAIGETFEVNGLSHFPVDIESSIEKSHRNIVPGGSAVFQAGGLLVILVEVQRKAYLASIVPVIVNAVLNEHQLIPDIIAFVAKGDFPRSRLGEKQRGKILASWVTRKMRMIAQFGIRDPEAADSSITVVPEDRVAGQRQDYQADEDLTPPTTGGGSRSMDPAAYYPGGPAGSEGATAVSTSTSRPYSSSIVESPPANPEPAYDAESTPTGVQGSFPTDSTSNAQRRPSASATGPSYFSMKPSGTYDAEQTPQAFASNATTSFDGTGEAPAPPPKDYHAQSSQRGDAPAGQQGMYTAYRPGVHSAAGSVDSSAGSDSRRSSNA